MGRGIHDVAVGPENVLRAIAVMDVEIHDRDALRAMDGDGVPRGHGGVVEEAEAHGRRAFGMVAGRPHGDEGVVHVAAHDFVHRLAGAADGVNAASSVPGLMVVSLSSRAKPSRGDVSSSAWI